MAETIPAIDAGLTPKTMVKAKRLARHYRQKNTPLYVHGAPGVGKSQMFRQIADEANEGFIDIRAGMKLPEDFSGIPVPDLEKQIAVWLKANFWPDPKRDGERGIILFDELTDTSKPVQSCLYQVILDRRCGEHELAPGWWPCAAGNRRADRAAAQALSTALANRFAHIDLEPDPESWVLWALGQEHMGHLVPGFIKFRPALLHSMAGADLRAFPTPRSWEQVAINIDGCEEGFMGDVIEGLVGSGASGEFMAYLRTIDMPDIEEIEANPQKCRIPNQPSSKWALSCMISRYMTRQNIGKLMEYMKRVEFGKDFEISGVIAATQRDDTLTMTKPFTEFANRNKHLQL